MWILTERGVETHDQDWIKWAEAQGMRHRVFDNALQAYRAYWREAMPGWSDDQVEDAARRSAWPFTNDILDREALERLKAEQCFSETGLLARWPEWLRWQTVQDLVSSGLLVKEFGGPACYSQTDYRLPKGVADA